MARRVSAEDVIAAQQAAQEGFARGLSAVSWRWRGRIVDLLSRARFDRRAARELANIVTLQREVARQLEEAGYRDLLRAFVGSYARREAVDRAREVVERLGYKPARASAFDASAIRNIARMDYAYMAEVGRAAVGEVSRAVTANALSGQPVSEMIASVDKVLDGRFRPHAATYAQTALISFDRRATWETWKASGVELVKYRGPADVKNRKWCAARVNKVFRIADVERMKNDNGPQPPCFYGGGWNCRHVWFPEQGPGAKKSRIVLPR